MKFVQVPSYLVEPAKFSNRVLRGAFLYGTFCIYFVVCPSLLLFYLISIFVCFLTKKQIGLLCFFWFVRYLVCFSVMNE